jgi:hypothetical protein
MAIVVQLPVTPASRADADDFDAAMEAVMSGQGGPPEGLTDGGFMIWQVWRAEVEMRAYYEQTILPQLAVAGLAHGEVTTSPVWSLARP